MQSQTPPNDYNSENATIERVIAHPIDEVDDDIAFIHKLDEKMRQFADLQAA